MPNFLNDPYLMPTFLVPGLVALFVRAQFVPERSAPRPADVLSYLIVSIIYYALVYVLVHHRRRDRDTDHRILARRSTRGESRWTGMTNQRRRAMPKCA